MKGDIDMDNNFLATWVEDDGKVCCGWFPSEEEVLIWIDEESYQYKDIDVIEIVVVREIYKSE
jgi:hypothetical protein